MGTGCDGRRLRQARLGVLDDGAARGRQSRVVLAPRRWCQVREAIRGRWWLTSPAHQGDHGEAVKTIAQGMPGQSGEPVATMLVCSLATSHTRLRVHWASGIPCALVFEWRKIPAKPGRIAPRERGSVSHCRHCEERLARSACDEAIQKCYCGSNLDCFAEPVIGRDFAHYDDVW